MNKRQAMAKGYKFHGAFSWDKAEVKERAAALRKAGNAAVVVSEPPDKLSRGHRGTGYSVYWIESEQNALVRKIANFEHRLSNLRARQATLLAEVSAVTGEISVLEQDVWKLRSALQREVWANDNHNS